MYRWRNKLIYILDGLRVNKQSDIFWWTISWSFPGPGRTILLQTQVRGNTKIQSQIGKVWRPFLRNVVNPQEYSLIDSPTTLQMIMHYKWKVNMTKMHRHFFQRLIAECFTAHLPISFYTYLHFKKAQRQSLRHATRKAFS